MADTPKSILFALLLLTLVTGVVDAASVLGLGHVFTANMTGNVVYLGFALVGKGTSSVTASLDALGCFLVGAAVGGRVTKSLTLRSVRVGVGIEITILVIATAVALAPGDVATAAVVSLLALAMGLRNAVIRRLGVPDMTTTVLTLTLTGLAADSSLAGGNDPRWARRVLAVVVMLSGALLGAATLRLGIAVVVGVAAGVEALAVAILALRWQPAQSPAS